MTILKAELTALPRGQRHRKTAFVAAVLTSIAVLCWRFPPFRVVPLRQAQELEKAGSFNAAETARALWKTTVLSGVERAADAAELLAALAKDEVVARKRYGRVFGVSSATLFFLKGDGRVTAIEPEAVVATLDSTGSRIKLSTGPLFGNVVRDGTGSLDVSDYANSQDFNAISAQLNLIVETDVTPTLRDRAEIGKAIRFVGCAKLEKDATAETLSVVALSVEWP